MANVKDAQKNAKSVKRHAKQKAALENKGNIESTSTYVPTPTLSSLAKDLITKKGYNCIEGDVLMFPYPYNGKEAIEIKNILLKEFGRDETLRNHIIEPGAPDTVIERKVPFSFGFGGVNKDIKPIVKETYVENFDESEVLEEDI